MKEVTLVLSPKQAADSRTYVPIAARLAGIAESQVAFARIVRRSVDARRGAVKVNLTVQLFADAEPAPPPVRFDYPDVSHRPPVAIIGAGPAGLFAALRLIELGLRPVIVERGKQVAERKRDIAAINRNGPVDPDSNYAFGEGGAGTFSDGKLFTRSKKRGDYNRALETLVFHGAADEILYDAHPHIGTDRLPRVVGNICRTITGAGGTVLFGRRVTDIIIKAGRAVGVECGGERTEAAAVIVAAGHSSRDIYELLHRKGVALEAKPYAMGVRVEHPQVLIDSIQYRMPERGEWLPAAAYSLTAQVAGRGVYSFCMCPGGFIVPAMTAGDQCVVNGMSPSGRNSPWANAAIVAEVRAADFAHLNEKFGVLAGLEFQKRIEQTAQINGGGQRTAPAQRVGDFVAGRASASLPRTSYVPGAAASDLGGWLPDLLTRSLREGLREFDRKMRGFVTNEALLVGVESRTSTPVRIPRDPATLRHPQVAGLYPAGEGAGYAGGIISAALDGERIADAIAEKLKT